MTYAKATAVILSISRTSATASRAVETWWRVLNTCPRISLAHLELLFCELSGTSTVVGFSLVSFALEPSLTQCTPGGYSKSLRDAHGQDITFDVSGSCRPSPLVDHLGELIQPVPGFSLRKEQAHDHAHIDSLLRSPTQGYQRLRDIAPCPF